MIKPMRWLILLGAAVVGTWFVYQAVFAGNRAESEPESTATPQAQLSAAKADYTDALGRAKSWQGNATLTRVYRLYQGTITPDDPLPLVYSFSSLADPGTAFEVHVTPKDVVEKKVPKQPFELGLVPIDTGQWQIDPAAALTVAEDNGGKVFREQHLAGYKVLQQLSKNAGHGLQWYFRYDAGDGTRMRLEFYINAENGSVDSRKESVV